MKFTIRDLGWFVSVCALVVANVLARKDVKSAADAWTDGYCWGRADESFKQFIPMVGVRYPEGSPKLNPFDGSSVTGRQPATYDERDFGRLVAEQLHMNEFDYRDYPPISQGAAP